MATRTILLIEDEEHLRHMTAAILEREGFVVLEAADANEAFEIWSRDHASIDLLFADIVIPGLSGPEIAREFRQVRKDLKVIFTSGNTGDMALETAHLIPDAKLLRKPYVKKLLIDAILAYFPHSED